ncbi:beta-N-acetylhexosaminidase [Longispora albida]|uniref:beta-N-acetylhexosaminidase n=1 Tax=Longispora albida TaxID=203523 RepID=UPI000363542D|nr:beta-N-acetylhexosaminidase [Longispora albida]
MLIPQPVSHQPAPGHFALSAATRVSGPPEITTLLRELLGLPLPPGGDITFTLTEGHGPEGYELDVTTDGVAATASTVQGLRWAVQSIAQLAPQVPCGRIVDAPKHAWRGALLDVGRWHHPIGFLHTFADILAAHKLNVFHLHLTEDQGWRFEVKRYPRLTSVGAHRRSSPLGHTNDGLDDGRPHGGFYTQEELRGLVAYAASRGVLVVPEIDLPGHTQAAIAAYPELGNRPEVQHEVMTRFGVSEHVLNAEESTVEFMCHVLDELVDVFGGPYVHLGGDEVPLAEWSARYENPERLLGWWISRLAAHLRTHGRRPIVWDELVGAGVPEDAIIMAWRGPERVGEALAAGHEVIAVPQSHMYLDHGESTAPGEPLSITGPLPLDRVYSYDPGPGVLGVQGNLWSEYLPTPERAQYNLLPRLAAVAEVAWGTAGDAGEFRARLAGLLPRYEAAGWNYRPLD